jgi:hypothetical protein
MKPQLCQFVTEPSSKKKPDGELMARLSIMDGDKMTDRERLFVANWLRKQALAFEKEGHLYSSRFVACKFRTEQATLSRAKG